MSDPLLSVNEIAIDRVHQCAAVVVCIGGRSARLLLGMLPAGAVRWDDVPVELQSHSVVRRRLFELVQRVHDGERIDLPSDLSARRRGRAFVGSVDPVCARSDAHGK